MKLHLGNGTIYLDPKDGWVNIDILGKLASESPELVKHNITTMDKYYKYPWRTSTVIHVTDMIMDARDLSYFDDNSIEEILSVNLIDHMKKNEFLKTLQEWRRVLRVGGKLIVDVDDRRKQANVLVEAKTQEEMEWGLRLIYCDSKWEGRTHFWGYTPEYLKTILEDCGFKHEWTRNDYIVHDAPYIKNDNCPNFQICAIKK